MAPTKTFYLKRPMANHWRTDEEIKQAYGYKDGTFYNLKRECLTTPYANAIIQPNKHNTFIDEDLWQKFLKYKSDQYMERIYGI